MTLDAQQTLDTRIGKLTFTHDFADGYPIRETIEKLFDERDFQRACQVYLWAMPFVSAGEVERVLMQAPGAAHGDIVLVETYSDLSRFLTANATTPYAVIWLNLARNGPFVLEIPAGPSAGFVDDLWQRPVTDIGLPGPDKGQGGMFIVVGPGQNPPPKRGRLHRCANRDVQQPRDHPPAFGRHERTAGDAGEKFASTPLASARIRLPPRSSA